MMIPGVVTHKSRGKDAERNGSRGGALGGRRTKKCTQRRKECYIEVK